MDRPRATKLTLALIGAALAATQLLVASIPESARSRRVAAEVGPRLERELEQAGLRMGDPVYIRIFKTDSPEWNQPKRGMVELWMRGSEGTYRLFKSYPVCARSGKLGPKLASGDLMTPEGFYGVTSRALNPESDYKLAMNIGYPNLYDRARNRTGSQIMVHGKCISWGCVAIEDGIDEVYTLAAQALKNGQAEVPVHVFPFPLTGALLDRAKGHSSASFWEELREGYDSFENRLIPPVIQVRNGRYRVTEN